MSTTKNYADKIRAQYKQTGSTGGFNLSMMRDIANDKQGNMAATSELGKLGIKLADLDTIEDDRTARAEYRRAMNALTTHVREDIDNRLTDNVQDALECLSARIDIINHQEDMDATAARHFAGRCGYSESDTILHDHAGQRIGVLLSNADLRDEAKIAAKLRTEQRAFAADDGKDGNLTAFFRGIAGGRTTESIKASLSEGTDSEGGHVVPSWLLPGILKALVPASSMLQAGANVAVLDQPGDSFKVAALDSVPTAAWRDENGALSESDPTFRSVTIVPRSLAFIFKVSRELLMDAPGMEQSLRVAIAQAFAKEIDRAGLIGTGTAPEIRGVLNTTGINTYSMGADGAELTNYAPIIKAARTIADDNAPAPTAIITSNREAETMDLFVDTTGQPLRRPPALDALKFIATSQVPTDDTQGTATDAGSMYLGNWSFATFYMREQLSVLKLNELYAANGQVGFACHARVDLALAYPSAFCTIKGVIPAA
ncbi:MAG TPA: phage major capsid protein [Rhodanobacteraceae bacterium]